MRSIEELKTAVERAGSTEDADALEQCALEYEAIATTEALALAAMTRGSVERIRGNVRAAVDHYQRALEMFTAIGDKQKIASVCANLSISEVQSGNHASAMEYVQRALELYKELGDGAGEANAYHVLGSVHYATSELALALQYYQRSMALREEQGDARGSAISLANIGNVYDGIGNYPQALENFHRALEILQDVGDRKEVARITGNIGVVYRNTGNHELSLEYNQRSLKMHEELNDRNGIAYNTGSLGALFAAKGRYTEALECYRRSLDQYEELSNREAVARMTARIILALINNGAIEEADSMLAVFENVHVDHPSTLINRLYARSMIQMHAGDLDLAMETCGRALQIAIELSNAPSQAVAHANLRDLCLKRNDFAGYIEHNNEYNRITNEINSKDIATKLALLEAEQKMAKERAEHERHLAVLHSTLPKHIADRVSRGEQVNDHYDNASVIFLDIVDFTTISEQLTSDQVVLLLDQIFTALDAVCEKYDVVKIKTIGDSYMAVAFPNSVPHFVRNDSSTLRSSSQEDVIPSEARNGALRAASAALDMLHAVSHIVSPTSSPEGSPEGSPVRVRIGIHSGTLTAGVIGTTRHQYDVWGDTVNTASRLEATGEPGRIHVSESFAMFLTSGLLSSTSTSPPGPLSSKRGGIDLTPIELEWGGAVGAGVRYRGQTELKGKGTMTTYWLEGA